MTRLRKMMLEELQRRNYAQTTIKNYLGTVESFAQHFGRPPDQLGLDEIRSYQVYLLKERKMGVRTVGLHTAGLRFFFCKTLRRNYPVEEFPYPKKPRELPIILTQQEAVRLIESASNLFHRAMLMTLYSTGMRRAELCHLKVENIDSERMLVHIRHGKGGRDRSVPLSPKLLETLREYYRWMKPKKPRRIQRHQHCSMEQGPRRVDQARHLVGTQNRRQALAMLRIGQLLLHIAPLEHLDVKESQRTDVQHDRADGEFLVFEQIRLVAAHVVRAEMIEPLSSVFSKLLDGS